MRDHAELARRNSARSMGPKTHAGRARSARNALRHGLRAAAIIFPGLEDVREWERHLAEIVGAWQPRSYLEELLVERTAVQSRRYAGGREPGGVGALIFRQTNPPRDVLSFPCARLGRKNLARAR